MSHHCSINPAYNIGVSKAGGCYDWPPFLASAATPGCFTWDSTCRSEALIIDTHIVRLTDDSPKYITEPVVFDQLVPGVFTMPMSFPLYGVEVSVDVGNDQPFAGGQVAIALFNLATHLDPIVPERWGRFSSCRGNQAWRLPIIGGFRTKSYFTAGRWDPLNTALVVNLGSYPPGTTVSAKTIERPSLGGGQ